VRPFMFHIYDPSWEAPLEFGEKEFSMVYVGHTKFRWRGMSSILRAIEPVRDCVGRIALVGEGWRGEFMGDFRGDTDPLEWKQWLEIRDDYYADQDYLQKLRVEACPPIAYPHVPATMSRAVFNPVMYRPLFEHLGLVTCRTFETPAAGTIPIFVLDREYVREIYGNDATALVLGDDKPHERIVDVLARPEHYADIVRAIRRDFAVRHSPEARLKELIEIVEA